MTSECRQEPSRKSFPQSRGLANVACLSGKEKGMLPPLLKEEHHRLHLPTNVSTWGWRRNRTWRHVCAWQPGYMWVRRASGSGQQGASFIVRSGAVDGNEA